MLWKGKFFKSCSQKRTAVVQGVSFPEHVCPFWLLQAYRWLGRRWTSQEDQLKYFVSNRSAATSRWSGTGYQHQCSCLRSFCEPASHFWGEAKTHRAKNSEANGRGTPREFHPDSMWVLPFQGSPVPAPFAFSVVWDNLELQLFSWSCLFPSVPDVHRATVFAYRNLVYLCSSA